MNPIAGSSPDRLDGVSLLISDPAAAAELLHRGGLVGLPTETVYGLAADACDPVAVSRVFAVKGRPADHPLIVHVQGAADLDLWARDLPGYARTLALRFWPGPLTLVLPRAPVAGDHVTGGLPNVGLRAPAHPVARAVLAAFAALRPGQPCGLAAPSANRFGRVSPTTAAHVIAELGDRLRPGVDAVLDGGPSGVGVESTILDCSSPAGPALLRPGAVSVADVRAAGVEFRPGPGSTEPGSTGTGHQPVRAPGMLAAHYAPEATVHLVEAADLEAATARLGTGPVGVLAPSSLGTPAGAVRLAAPAGPAEYAAVLYAALREADALRLAHVVAVAPDDDDLGPAIRDRLRRAAVGSGGAVDSGGSLGSPRG